MLHIVWIAPACLPRPGVALAGNTRPVPEPCGFRPAPVDGETNDRPTKGSATLTEAKTYTLDAPGAVLTYDVRASGGDYDDTGPRSKRSTSVAQAGPEWGSNPRPADCESHPLCRQAWNPMPGAGDPLPR